MGEDKYERLAKKVKGLFERELGKFSLNGKSILILILKLNLISIDPIDK